MNFYSRPCGRGDSSADTALSANTAFLLTPLREGRPWCDKSPVVSATFLLTPLREGRLALLGKFGRWFSYFYSRPCGRGDDECAFYRRIPAEISTHAPAGGATGNNEVRPLFLDDFYSRPCGRGDPSGRKIGSLHAIFLLTPLREGRLRRARIPLHAAKYFYSRPCGRGDWVVAQVWWLSRISTHAPAGGATKTGKRRRVNLPISTHAPAGGATWWTEDPKTQLPFLLTPLREGRLRRARIPLHAAKYFYSRPCGRGDGNFPQVRHEVLRQIAER